jgi:tetratricopeptide (TPR) repeat protein
MKLQKVFFLAFILFLVCHLGFTGELVSKESVSYFNEGVRAQKKSNFSEANTAFQKALLVDPYNPKWHRAAMNNQGILWIQQGDLERAESAFNAALAIDANYKPAQINLGLVYEKTKTRLEALEYWMKVFELEKLKPRDFATEEEEDPGKKK